MIHSFSDRSNLSFCTTTIVLCRPKPKFAKKLYSLYKLI
ncbi:unnamed protein product [Acanthoscelides obtectus]|uniref:Uncharacterized protein n=1 Tax=Acanthoscelides obtectus TaxID=200917 RepID=A0A9P0P640_ACAOB|nr:unnamed protein product [Acanthoscelides obtectus]CAK1672003.1 hypothetical protein AOBTE_LOCUS28603 [Acanthoscelides obtectus]